MKSIFILILAYLTLTPNNLNDHVEEALINCSVDLSVEKNRNYKSAYADGASFTLILTNTSSTTNTYSLSTKKLEEACKKSSENKNGNIDLQTSILMIGSKKLLNEEIILNGGQSYKFIVKVTAPEGTPYHNWGCIEVEATSKDCSSSSAKTILSVYLPDPSEH